MEKFDKSLKLDNVRYDIRGPIVDQAMKMEREGEKILKLNIGNPAPFGFTAPEEVIRDMVSNLENCEGYSESKGLLSARQAVVQYYEYKGVKDIDANDIYIGNGASELITLSMHALLNTDDEILVPAPDYPLWTASVNFAGGTPVHYMCDEQNEWNPDIEDIKKKITPNTKGIVIINPNNPTGALYSEELLKEIVEVARQYNLMIFADEIYDRLVMDGHTHIAMASLATDVPCVSLNGLSKSHRVAGFRVGWLMVSGDKKKMEGFIKGLNLLTSMRLCSNVPAQSIVKIALKSADKVDDLLLPGGRIYEQRNCVYEALSNMEGVSVVKPKASFYIFPKFDVKKFNLHDDEKFVMDFLKERKILIMHGRGFNYPTPDHARIVFLPREEMLRKAMVELEDFLKNYKQ